MNAQGKRTWCVAGGGVLGQVIALRLAQAGHHVSVLEAAPETGGLAASWSIDDIVWDKHYHVILPADRRTLELVSELGLSSALVWKRSRTGFFADGRLSPLNSAVDYLRLPSLGILAKARLAFTLMWAARIEDGRPLDQVPVGDWLTKWSGREAYERLWRPLLRAKLGTNDDRASAAFIWATVRRLYLARSAGAKTETLGFIDGGYDRILSALRDRLSSAGVDIVTGCPITRIAPQGDQLQVETAKGARLFDDVVSTLPCGVTARLCDALSPELKARLDSVVYQGIICASLVLDRPLGGYYLTYLTDSDLPFTAVVEMSALAGRERFGGKSLVYLPRYVAQDDPFWELDDGAVRARFVAGITRIYPDLDPGAIRAFRLSRVRNVMAVPTVGYLDAVPAVETNIPGFHIVNSAQITDGTLNVDATLGVAEAALPRLLGGAMADNLSSAA
ncbi:15-cis-phytoene desaturase [Defluviimonas aquaemixtae]|uniref:15-cis-phytoene desaturase n=1 Tax=Albidovulum aquaemixtae TaxID=1542388 RepID=A0A2R8B202_9RHOB|nr:NAD(P)/FAD-dependent oxidoreductase [Defluviimonas aquaemixtae]SPH16607.1 15-cis-phytoene desaturase [Defluviimonas aquaemixtae]